MYRILTITSKRDNYASLYKYLTTTNDDEEVIPVEIETKDELDAYVEDMLNNGGYAKSDFIIVNIIDYTIDAKDYSDDETTDDTENTDGSSDETSGDDSGETTEENTEEDGETVEETE